MIVSLIWQTFFLTKSPFLGHPTCVSGLYRLHNSSKKLTWSFAVAHRHSPNSNCSLYSERQCPYSPPLVFSRRLSSGRPFHTALCCLAKSPCHHSLSPILLAGSTICRYSRQEPSFVSNIHCHLSSFRRLNITIFEFGKGTSSQKILH